MPLYTIGKNHQPVRPSGAEIRSLGLKPDRNITDEEVNKWFDEAFHKFMEDPYVELDPSNFNDCTQFRTLALDDEGNIQMCGIHGMMNLVQADLSVKKALYQAAREGLLFYFDKSLGESGGMRQIYTKSSEVNGKMEQELCVTDDVREFAQASKPEAPAFWKYLLSIFSKSYRNEIQEYNTKVAEHKKVNTYADAILDNAADIRNEMQAGNTADKRQKMLDNKQARINAYEKAKKMGLEADNYKSPAEFAQEMKEYARMDVNDAFYNEFLRKNNPTVGDFCRGLVKIIMVQVAKKIMDAHAGKSDEQVMNELKEQQPGFRTLEKGLRAFVPTQINLKDVEELCKPMASGLREVRALQYIEPIKEHGLDDYFDSLPKAKDFQEKEMEQKQLQNEQPQLKAPSLGGINP